METAVYTFRSSRLKPLEAVFLTAIGITAILLGLYYWRDGQISESTLIVCIGGSLFISSLHNFKNWRMALTPISIDIFKSGLRINGMEVIPWEILVPKISEDQISFHLDLKRYASYDTPLTGIEKNYINIEKLSHYCHIHFQEIIRRDPSFKRMIMEINRVTERKYVLKEDPREPRRLSSKPKFLSLRELPEIIFSLYAALITIYAILGTIFIPSNHWILIGMSGNALLLSALSGYRLWQVKKKKKIAIPLYSTQRNWSRGKKIAGFLMLLLMFCYVFMIGNGKIANRIYGHEAQKELILKSGYNDCFSTLDAFGQTTCFSGIYDAFGKGEVTIMTRGTESFFGYFPEKFVMPDQTERTGDGKFLFHLKSLILRVHGTDAPDKTP